jgi:hypothetical protein
MPDCMGAKAVKDSTAMNKILLLAAIVPVLWYSSCDRNRPPVEPIPGGPVNTSINLSLPSYLYLQQPGSWMFLNGGSRGVLLVHDFNGDWKAFERTCGYQPTNQCSLIQVDSTLLQLRCGTYTTGSFSPCCASKYGFNGMPLGGPTPQPLATYRVQVIGSMLYINN